MHGGWCAHVTFLPAAKKPGNPKPGFSTVVVISGFHDGFSAMRAYKRSILTSAARLDQLSGNSRLAHRASMDICGQSTVPNFSSI